MENHSKQNQISNKSLVAVKSFIQISQITPSKNTIERRIESIVNNIKDQLIKRVGTFP